MSMEKNIGGHYIFNIGNLGRGELIGKDEWLGERKE